MWSWDLLPGATTLSPSFAPWGFQTRPIPNSDATIHCLKTAAIYQAPSVCQASLQGTYYPISRWEPGAHWPCDLLRFG